MRALSATAIASANARASQYVNTGNAISGAANSVGQYFALKDLYKAPTFNPTMNFGGRI